MPTRKPSSPQPSTRLRTLYEILAAQYGPQHWWPSQSPLETIVGACLTQGTAWTAVEHSLSNLRRHNLLHFERLRTLPIDQLRELIRPSGFMQRKAATLHALIELIHTRYNGSIEAFARTPLTEARAQLLAIPGIGPETADVILLYALNQPAMVVDEYLRRVAIRHGLAPSRASYHALQQLALAAFADEPNPAALADHCNEFHALIVQTGKDHCRRTPDCAQCTLRADLDTHLHGKPVPYWQELRIASPRGAKILHWKLGTDNWQLPVESIRANLVFMPLTLYVASSNPGKLRDFRTAAEHTPVEILPPPNLATIPAPEETGATFAENARLKAEYYSRHLPGQLVLADDSGLEVPALQNNPGVRSARYADDANYLPDSTLSTDARNNLFLLDRMVNITNRAARYRCVLSLARDGAEILSASGEVPGEILTAPRGTGGFGYDPLFYLPQLAKSMAEIDLDTKHHLSHRGAALRSLLATIQLKGIG